MFVVQFVVLPEVPLGTTSPALECAHGASALKPLEIKGLAFMSGISAGEFSDDGGIDPIDPNPDFFQIYGAVDRFAKLFAVGNYPGVPLPEPNVDPPPSDFFPSLPLTLRSRL